MPRVVLFGREVNKAHCSVHNIDDGTACPPDVCVESLSLGEVFFSGVDGQEL